MKGIVMLSISSRLKGSVTIITRHLFITERDQSIFVKSVTLITIVILDLAQTLTMANIESMRNITEQDLSLQSPKKLQRPLKSLLLSQHPNQLLHQLLRKSLLRHQRRYRSTQSLYLSPIMRPLSIMCMTIQTGRDLTPTQILIEIIINTPGTTLIVTTILMTGITPIVTITLL